MVILNSIKLTVKVNHHQVLGSCFRISPCFGLTGVRLFRCSLIFVYFEKNSLCRFLHWSFSFNFILHKSSFSSAAKRIFLWIIAATSRGRQMWILAATLRGRWPYRCTVSRSFFFCLLSFITSKHYSHIQSHSSARRPPVLCFQREQLPMPCIHGFCCYFAWQFKVSGGLCPSRRGISIVHCLITYNVYAY